MEPDEDEPKRSSSSKPPNASSSSEDFFFFSTRVLYASSALHEMTEAYGKTTHQLMQDEMLSRPLEALSESLTPPQGVFY